MKRFRDQLESEGLAERKVRLYALYAYTCDNLRIQMKTSNKRLSIEGAKTARSDLDAQPPTARKSAISRPVEQKLTPKGTSTRLEDTYVVQHVDVTEEVNRRLRESRLRRLMETPSTAQKRKFNAYDEARSESAAETEDEVGSRGGLSGSEFERTPTKRLKSSGTFERTGKRKENGYAPESCEQPEGRSIFKRRRV